MFARPCLAILAVLTAPAVVLGMAGAAWAGQDRYGPPTVRDEAAASDAAPVTYLSWPSKIPTAPIPLVAPAPPAANSPETARPSSPPRLVAARPLPASIYAPAPASYVPPPARPNVDTQAALAARPLRPAQTLATAKPSASRSAQRYATLSPQWTAPSHHVTALANPPPSASPPAANPQPAAVAANGAPPRFYSVQRQFGVSPDPAPLPAQFFADGASSDLASPPPPPAPHLIPGQSASSAANVQRANAAANIADGDAITSN